MVKLFLAVPVESAFVVI